MLVVEVVGFYDHFKVQFSRSLLIGFGRKI